MSDPLNDLTIDEYRLDRECLKQPKLMLEYSLKLSEAKRLCDEQKAKLERLRAKCSHRVRNSPSDYGLERATVEAVKSAVEQIKEVRTASNEVIQRQFVVDELNGICRAIDHRKRMLELLVSLHGQSYYSEPRVSNDDAETLRRSKHTRRMKNGKAKA